MKSNLYLRMYIFLKEIEIEENEGMRESHLNCELYLHKKEIA